MTPYRASGGAGEAAGHRCDQARRGCVQRYVAMHKFDIAAHKKARILSI
jgi:hypothetical protein